MTTGYFTALMKHIGYAEEEIDYIIKCALENAECMGWTDEEALQREWDFRKIYG